MEATVTGRLGIDDVRPRVSCGSLPAKAVVGEVIPLSALCWREGHDALAAAVVMTWPKNADHATGKTSIAMRPNPMNPDEFHALFVPDVEGTYTFKIEAYSDPVATWRHAVTAKINAGQGPVELANDLEWGARLFERACRGRSKEQKQQLTDVVASLRGDDPDLRARVAPAFAPEVEQMLAAKPLKDLTTRSKTFKIEVQRRKALFSSWYELFPRSTGTVNEDGSINHGTLATTADALDRVAAMGFDTVYFPPIHPIGEINRKGRNNTLTPEPGDVGSPWAIGSKDGGHDAIHPQLGTIEDFDALIAKAESLNLEVALDLALQCAPDHPWAAEHPNWFTVLPDGTIAYAENPPKKYQDIYPLNFDNDPEGLYREVLRVVEFWISHGVHTFRVDNPHTKPANFWEWLIARVHEQHPEVIFLAEAFTRQARLYGLAKAGFDQSYTYFTWQTSKYDLTKFAEEIAYRADICRPNLFVNTPDILHASLQYGGRGMFAIRAALAATMSPLWGMYSGYELFEHEAVAPGSEEYLNSEKYELRPRDFQGADDRGDSLELFITSLNEIRKNNPALQQLREITFHHTESEEILAYSKVDAATGNAVLVVVNLDPYNARETTVHLDLARIGQTPGSQFDVHDELTGHTYSWGEHNYVRLEPWSNVAHIFRLPLVPAERRAAIAFRRIDRYQD
ncbi:alpha-1,4-glucan--maltose-1-phosphate maltosyltransferase [Corynebacterium choanae]|uniref:Alpha-1,4-glucan:maltose-1-phosphate maltosyltransferase n=1 Tax=Corynebacterium choanae TaxID=1862358 RepID=A0A3G6J5X8_9CORY|nr:alpha-1,4-glucan--maltose-1-phosphate maltosyltransferase [Corynebacterium choanae]AZA13349.1 Alpha-1,4-glucan:maltose-1-phosphate maltosyltransferase [Corynebacterium choanae]